MKCPLSFHLFWSETIKCHKSDSTYLVAVDGTECSYNALRRAFECSNGADRVIAVHFPASMERLEVELMIFGPNNLGAEMQRLKTRVEKNKRETVEQISETAAQIKDEYVAKHKGMEGLQFEIKIGDPSPSAKHDIVRACHDFKADSLFLGSRGSAHSFREKVQKTIIEHVGSVPDYCVHNAPCDVMVVKPAEF